MTGSGTLADPYIIQNVNDLQAMQNGLDAYYELGNNIDASGTLTWNWNAGRGVFEGFEPIGEVFHPFTGTLDGKGYVISGLYMNRSEDECGLFCWIDSAEISNVFLTNVNINANAVVGALVGRIRRSTITNCHIISGAVSGLFIIGGLAGRIEYASSTITRCSSGASVYASNYGAGGLFGDVANATVEQCHTTGNVVVADTYMAGGFAGWIRGSVVVKKCYATGNVNAPESAGGFTYMINAGSVVSDSYARGNATATNPESWSAGFVVFNNSGALTERCYSTGEVTAADAGGFCTYNDGTITACFWDTQTSGQATSDGGTGKTSEEMNHMDIFLAAVWDFTSTWNISRVSTVKSGNLTSGSALLDGLLDLTIINDAYPFLRWQTVVELPCNCGFEWGETELFGNFTAVDSKNTGESFAKPIAGLEAQRTYYYRARASASPGPIHGGTKSFTTLVAIEVETLPATNITENSARIWGRVRKVPITAMARFDWGGNIEYGAQTPWAQGLVSDDMFYYDLTKLAEGRAYHFRAVAMGSSLVYGNDMTFTTRSPVGPVVLIQEELAHLMEVS